MKPVFSKALVMMVDVVSWKADDEMLMKRVSAAEHLHCDWSQYESECDEAETAVNRLESELDVVIADTDPQHVHTCLEQLQVCTTACAHLPMHHSVNSTGESTAVIYSFALCYTGPIDF